MSSASFDSTPKRPGTPFFLLRPATGGIPKRPGGADGDPGSLGSLPFLSLFLSRSRMWLVRHGRQWLFGFGMPDPPLLPAPRNHYGEPLPNLEIQRDLVVDMELFGKAYQSIQPWLHTQGPYRSKSTPYRRGRGPGSTSSSNCILCACCYGACPVIGRDPDYLGLPPWRSSTVSSAMSGTGGKTPFWRRLTTLRGLGMRHCFRCIDACPKEVRPTDGISALRRGLVTRVFGRKR